MNKSDNTLLVAYLEPDEHSREGLAELLKLFFKMSDLEAEVSFVYTADEVIDKALLGAVDIFVCDLSLNDKSPLGLGVIEDVKERCPWLFCVAVSKGDEVRMTEVDARQYGYDMFIPKGALAGDTSALDNVPSYKRRFMERFRYSPVRTYRMTGKVLDNERGITVGRTELLPLLRQLISYKLPLDGSVIIREVELSPLTGGRSASRVFTLRGWLSDKRQTIQPTVIKIASCDGAREEVRRYDTYVRWSLPQHVRVDLMASGFTTSQGAIMYSFAYGNGPISTLRQKLEGGNLAACEEGLRKLLQSFGSFWQPIEPTVQSLTVPARYLHRYYAGSTQWFNEDVAKYRLYCGRVNLPIKHDNHTVTINGESLPNLSGFLQLGDGIFNQRTDGEWAIVHGDLNPGNVVFSSGGEVALIDFRDAGLGHRFEDWITLEACARMFWKWDDPNPTASDSFQQAIKMEDELSRDSKCCIARDDGWRLIGQLRTAFIDLNGGPLPRSFYYGLAYYCFRLLRIQELSDVLRARILAAAYASVKVCAKRP